MTNVITALDNPILNNELKKVAGVNVLLNDLQYKEAIIEFMEKNIKINYVVISELLPGEIKLNDLTKTLKNKDKNIKIILLKERKNYKENNIEEENNIDYIFYDNEVDIKDIINIIENKKAYENEKLKQDIELLKRIVLNKNNKILKNMELNNFQELKKENKIITVLGAPGVGKSIFTIMLSKILKKQSKKNLIIDFDILNNNIHTILGIKKYSDKINCKSNNSKYKIEDFIININENIDLISGLNLLFEENKQIPCNEITENIKSIKENYDYIIIDTSSECFFEYNKEIILASDLSVFLIEANLLEIKKARKLLDIYEKEWKINKDKINIIINKYNNYSVKDNVLYKLFDGKKILGKIQMSDYYNYIINKNNKIKFQKNNIKNEYIKVSEKLLKVNFENKNNKIKDWYNKIINNKILYKNRR